MVDPGLSESQATSLLDTHGLNVIQEAKSISPIKIFLAQLTSPLIFILIFASTFSVILKEFTDAIFILIVVFINSLLGFYQEYKAENTLEKLKKSVSKHVNVIRDGKIKNIDTSLLVPGDLIMIEPGLRIPADGNLVEANELLINEAVLTGESEPVEKNLSKIETRNIFMGTLVIEGLGKAKISGTGANTKFGQIAKSLNEEETPATPIKLELLRLSKIITIFVLVLIVIIFFLGIINGLEFKEIFLTAVALGVSTIPEGLIISLTVTLALGMNRLLAKKALVKNLPAAETLGDVDVLCVDKTGTLTYGNMQVADYDFVDKQKALTTLAISNNESNFIDQAIHKYIENVKGIDFINKTQSKRKHLFPFSSEKKYTGAYDGKTLYAVGAPEVILSFCKGDKKKWSDEAIKKAKEGNRTLALCSRVMEKESVNRDDFKNMDFEGLVFIKDPVRDSVADSILAINNAGIEVKVITGDLKETAVNVLKTLNIDVTDKEMLSGNELTTHIENGTLPDVVLRTKLFYRTTPDQKLAIVKALQKRGKVVGMMGDGVNDSPALKAAEIGLVVDNATDVSKEVADIILLDSNFQTIEAAVEEGRNIIHNLRKIIVFLISDSLTETVLILLSLVFLLPLPLTPVLLLWINIIEDGIPSLALAFEKSPKNILLKKHSKAQSTILDKKVLSLVIATSLIKDLLFFVVYYWLVETGVNIEIARTVTFASISFSSLLFLFSVKTLETQLWKDKLFNNKVVNFAFLSGVLMLLVAIYLPLFNQILGTKPLEMNYIIAVVSLSGMSICFIEIAKFLLHKVLKR
ncbi:cation-transporting P-type ATPase [Candidatus Dojkabacteria bacterium]|uniref:Cation-transporting P-type ATPase n=1 Tax=Candidatus Dojkabacteria bacterium TaxID=2099670 RepID=A0A955I8V7_9BACT|nr:cation-transporting P-type ATPase [Candidatus Dojkabacteria bacterium]